jgi:hypothetical protein
MKLIEIPTGSLDGISLDWALAMIADKDPEIELVSHRYQITAHMPTPLHPQMRAIYRPSTVWKDVGDLIDSYDVWLSSQADSHIASCFPHGQEAQHYGPTKLIAAGRAIIQKRCGDFVWIPAILHAQSGADNAQG